MIGNSQAFTTSSINDFVDCPTQTKSLVSGSLFALLCINANVMAQTALQNIVTSIVNAPYPSNVFGSSGTRMHTFTIAHPKSILLNIKQWLF